MLTGEEIVFPNNIVALLQTRFSLVDGDFHVVPRPLRISDPDESIGIFAAMWSPDPESYEIRKVLGSGGPGPSEPSISRYVVSLQSFVKDMDEQRGLARHSVMSTIVRSILYRDEPLRVALSQLNTQVVGVRERTLRWGVTTQRFLNNELGDNDWLFLSTLEFWLDTEIY